MRGCFACPATELLCTCKIRPPSRHGPERTEEVAMGLESAKPIEIQTVNRQSRCSFYSEMERARAAKLGRKV